MNDLEKVLKKVDEKQSLIQQENLEKSTKQKERDSSRRVLMAALNLRVKQFKEELASKVKIHVVETSLNKTTVSFRWLNPLISKPYCTVKIEANFFGTGYDVQIKEINNDVVGLTSITLEKVIEVLVQKTADFMENSNAAILALPQWYKLSGEVFGWLLFVVTWVLSAFAAGIWGGILGWIPALIVKFLSRIFWLPIIIIYICLYN